MKQRTFVEWGLAWLGILYVVGAILIITFNLLGFAIAIPEVGFNRAQALATSNTVDSPGETLLRGLALLFASEILKRLRQISSK